MEHTDTPIRVLQIFKCMPVCGGAENLIMNYYRHLDRSRIQFDFLLHSKDGYDEEIRALGGRTYYMSLKNLPGLIRFFRSHPEYKIIQGHPPGHALIYFTAAKLCGVPVRIAHSHNIRTEPTLKGRILARIIPWIKYLSNVYWACSIPAGRYMFGKDREFQVIYNAISAERFCPDGEVRARMRSELGVADRFVVGHVGRFCPQKNQKFLLQIFKEVKSLRAEAVLLLIGTGALEGELRAEARRLGLEDSVRFLKPQTNIEDFYRAMDVFLLPSLFEGLGIVLIEAQACGLPCVVSTQVPSDADITGQTVFVPLDAAPQVWAGELVNGRQAERTGLRAVIQKAGYDIGQQASLLAEKYEFLAAQCP